MPSGFFIVPVALISVVEEEKDRQFFASQKGLPEPFAQQRQTPLSHSFCQHVKRMNRPLVVSDARKDDLVKDNKAVQELNVIAYLGTPICGPDGVAIGAVCVIKDEPKDWTPDDLLLLNDLARCVNDEILLRASLVANKTAHDRTKRHMALRDTITAAFMAPDLSVEARFSALLNAGCKALGTQRGFLTRFGGAQSEVLFSCGVTKGLSTIQSDHNSTSAMVRSGGTHICFDDAKNAGVGRRSDPAGYQPGSYAGVPLVLDGVLYGTLEFVSCTPRNSEWTEEDLSILKFISMIACAHLGLFGQIQTLRASENTMVEYVLNRERRVLMQ